MRRALAGMKSHRSAEFDSIVLPQAMTLIQVIGHRMAYDAAVAAKVDQCLIDLYVASCVKLESAWYVENAGLSRSEQQEMERKAIDAVFPRMEEFLEKMDVEPYISAPLVSDDSWEAFLDTLPMLRAKVSYRYGCVSRCC